jgi:hypothetical protein
MSNFVDIAYLTQAIGRSPAAMQALMQAVPFPTNIIANLGLRRTADNTTAINPVTRTIRMAFGPSGLTDAVVVLQNNGTIFSVTPGNRGNDYIKPPRVSLSQVVATPAQLAAFLRVNALDLTGIGDSAGAGYTSAPNVALIGGLPPANLTFRAGCVRTIYLLEPGLGYPMGTTVTIDGGGSPNPLVQATATCTVDAFGRITSVTLTNMGKGYVSVPKVTFRPPAGSNEVLKQAKAGVSMAEGSPAQVTATIGMAPSPVTGFVIVDPGDGYIAVPDVLITGGGGSGAVATARMEIGRIDVLYPGKGYTGNVTAVFTPFFKQLFPDTTDQAAPFNSIFQSLFVIDAVTPIISAAPVLT